MRTAKVIIGLLTAALLLLSWGCNLWGSSDDGDSRPPGEITGLSVDDRFDQAVELSWTNPTDRDFDRVEISFGVSSPSTTFVGTVDPGGTLLSGLTNGQQYRIRLRTVDLSGNASPGVTTTAGPPSAACGDGITQTSAGEACDDGNTTAGDGCDPSCQIEP
jgi:cysteine-rich repeat protein